MIGAHAERSFDRKTALTALAISALWGGNVVALKAGLAAFPPMWSAFWRMAIGLPVLAGWMRLLGVTLRPLPGEWRALTILSALFTGQIVLLNTAVDYTSAAYAVVLLNSNPIFTSFVAHFFVPGDRLSGARILGLAIAFAGICFVFLGEPEARLASRPLLGNAMATLTAIAFAARMVFTQRLVQRVDPLRTTFWQVALSMPGFLVLAVLLEDPLRGPLEWQPLAAIFYQGAIVVGGCFVIWVRLLQRSAPGLLSVYFFPTPIFGVIASALIFSERLAPELVVGVLTVAAGILIVTLEAARRTKAMAAKPPGVQKAA